MLNKHSTLDLLGECEFSIHVNILAEMFLHYRFTFLDFLIRAY